MTIRPCGYCIALVSHFTHPALHDEPLDHSILALSQSWCDTTRLIHHQFTTLFLTSSPSSPFVDRPHPSLPINETRPLSSPVEQRNWLSANVGRWMDPGLVGYRYIASIDQQEYTEMQDLRRRAADAVSGVYRPVQAGAGDGSDSDEADNGGEGKNSLLGEESASRIDSDPDVKSGMRTLAEGHSQEQARRQTALDTHRQPHWPWKWLLEHIEQTHRLLGLSGLFNVTLIGWRRMSGRPPYYKPAENRPQVGESSSRTTGSYAVLSASPTTTVASLDTTPSSNKDTSPVSPASAPSDFIMPPIPTEIPQYITTTDPAVLPPNYLDLRWRGYGIVLDLGFRRSEAGMAWEVSQVLHASEERVAARRREVEELEGDAAERLEAEKVRETVRLEEERVRKEEEEREKRERKERKKEERRKRDQDGWFWGQVPVVGDH